MAVNEMFRSICDEDIWDTNQTWYTIEPNFNRCLRHTISIWIPCAFLVLFATLETLSVKSTKVKQFSWRLLNTSRLALTIAAIFANCTEFVFYLQNYVTIDKYPYVLFVSSAMKVIAFVMVALLLLHQKRKGLPSLATPWTFVVIHILFFIPTLSQLWLHKQTLSQFEFYFNVGYFSLLVILFIAYSFADVSPKRKDSFNEKPLVAATNHTKRSPCPENTASFPSIFLFWWFTSLTYLGYKKPLVTDDIFDLNEDEKSEMIVPVFEKNWFSSGAFKRLRSDYSEVSFEIPSKKKSIVKTMLKTFWYDLVIAGVLLFLNTAFVLLAPVLLQFVLRFMSSKDPTWHGIVIVVAMFFTKLLANINLNFYYLRTTKLRVKMQACLTSMIYKKSLVTSSAAKKTSTTGEVVNLMSADIQRLSEFAQHFLTLFTTPVVIIVALWLLYNQVGYAVYGGFVVLLLMVPISYVASHFISKLLAKLMKFKDERLKYLNEVLNGMKVLKLYAWEPSFIKLIDEIRGKEMNTYKRLSYLVAVLMLQSAFAPFLIVFATLAVYCFSDSSHVLDSEKIFVTVNVIEVINSPLGMLPYVVSYAISAYVSCKRLDVYLNSAELEDYVKREESQSVVEIKNGLFTWDSGKSESSECNDNEVQQLSTSGTLVDINFKVKPGSLHAIVGSVGSGKSSFLSAVLGEMEKVGGSVNIHRNLKIAYVSQQAWIENLTLRDNILFGKEYREKKYDEVVDACALRPDFQILPAGDMTEIGERGINMSGGQKQRISLARAAYSDADLYLFDDPLSAVDAHVAKHLFDHLFSSKSGILKDKTRILVTNRVDVLSETDFITVLKEGRICEQGTYEELMEMNEGFAEFMNEYSGSNAKSPVQHMSVSNEKSDVLEKKKERNEEDTLIEEESAEVGSVKLSIYKKYLKEVSMLWSTIIAVAMVVLHVSLVAGNIWLSEWSSDNMTGDSNHDTAQRNYRFEIFAAIGVIQILMAAFANYLFVKAGVQAAINLHRKLLNRLFRCPMSFFETTPFGRILNRFSKDMDSVDVQILWNLRNVLDFFLKAIAAVAVISLQIGFTIVLIIPLTVAYYFIQTIYIPTSRQLQRLDAITRSPIYAHFTQTLQGVSTIRAFNEAKRFIKESDKRVELNLMCFYALNVAGCWLNTFLNLFGSIVVLFVGLYAAFQRDTLTAGVVGLSITYALMITETLNLLVRGIITVETNIISVERIQEYCENETEAEWINEAERPPVTWPEKGMIDFDQYGTRYRPGLDLVLNNITASIHENEKIGIVGRTGAGKSTITLSLFRILEAAKGKIVIDGRTIADLGLHDLRSKLTIIPQDPVLFSGTLRFNLDPFEAYSDDQIWEALEHSHLKQFVSELEEGLLYEITEGGENLSVGQRQLMCLARALLRKSKILILDEATASVDLETDSLIQTTIRTEFANCTTLTVAHRIQTILDCDRVMVIDKGTVLEFDSPSNLLSDSNSMFYSLAKNAGVVS